MQKFENMDVIAALETIMHQNTAYYQSDFAYDIKMLRESARSDQPEDKLLLWLSRPSGTFCFRERDASMGEIVAAILNGFFMLTQTVIALNIPATTKIIGLKLKFTERL